MLKLVTKFDIYNKVKQAGDGSVSMIKFSYHQYKGKVFPVKITFTHIHSHPPGETLFSFHLISAVRM